MYIYRQTEPQLWTVGHYDSDEKWNPESDWGTPEQAADRVIELNGGAKNPDVEEIKKQFSLACDVHYNRGLRAALVIVETVTGSLTDADFGKHKSILDKIYQGIKSLSV